MKHFTFLLSMFCTIVLNNFYAQEVTINSNLAVESDGTVRLDNSATTYNDIVVPFTTVKVAGSNIPAWTAMKDDGSGSRGVFTYNFTDQGSAANEEEVFFTVQLPHDWKVGTDIEPHVHWSPQTNANGVIRWGFEYTWVNYDGTTQLVFPNTQIIYVNTNSITGSTDVDKHMLTSFGNLTPSSDQNKISSILVCRFFRNSSNAADTYTGAAAAVSFDFHYEIDGFGSRLEYVK